MDDPTPIRRDLRNSQSYELPFPAQLVREEVDRAMLHCVLPILSEQLTALRAELHAYVEAELSRAWVEHMARDHDADDHRALS